MELGLDWHGWFTIALILSMFSVLVFTRLPADIVFLGGMVLLLFTGTVDVKTALSGFSDRTVITIGALLVVVTGLRCSGVIAVVVRHLLGTPRSYLRAIFRLMVPIALISTMVNNITVVSLFVTAVKDWSKKLGIPASKLLIPLSYSSIMGGVCLLIGTTANLMAAGIYADLTGKQMSIFATTLPGLISLSVGAVSMALLSKFLPHRQSIDDRLGEGTITEARAERGSSLVGLSLAEAGIPLVGGSARLVGIVSYDGEVVRSPSPDTLIIPGDTLAFAGERSEVVRIARRSGLVLPFGDTEASGGIAKGLFASVVMVAMVMLSALNVFPLLHCALGAAALMLIAKCCPLVSARKALDIPMLMVFASSVVLGKAVDCTGIAQMAADFLMRISSNGSPMVALIAICAIASVITEFISNTACAAVLTPIAFKLALALGVNPMPFIIGTMLSCSASFATPTGSPTNMLVYGPGGYRFSDFLRVGLPLNVIMLAANVFSVHICYPF